MTGPSTDPPDATEQPARVALGTPAGRWLLLATALGSSMAYLDSTVVTVTLTALSADLHPGVEGLQWVIDSHLVSLTAFLLVGGALGDKYGRRRVFRIGVIGFAATSVLCGLAPNTELLVAARALQGGAAALVVPVSLALLSTAIRGDQRSRTIGWWAGLTGVTSAIGPFVGGWLVDVASWRWAFFLNAPVGAVALWGSRHVPEGLDEGASGRLDLPGAVTAIVGLTLLTSGLIIGSLPPAILGLAVLAGFVLVERRSANPMLPPSLFASGQFVGANVVTVLVYAGLGAAFFLVVLQLQIGLGYSALEAGSALAPVTLAAVALSSRMGELSQRIGPRTPMTVGPLVAAAGLLAFAGVTVGDTYKTAVLPAAVVLGVGLAITVAPLTAAVLADVGEHHVGVGSAANYAAARLAGLLAVAVLPSVAAVELAAGSDGNLIGYELAMTLSAAACAAGGLVAWLTIRNSVAVSREARPTIFHACLEQVAGVPPARTST